MFEAVKNLQKNRSKSIHLHETTLSFLLLLVCSFASLAQNTIVLKGKILKTQTQFTKDMSIKVKVYDLLDQNQNASRYITSTAVVDSENTVLKRYAMFSLLYKFQNFETKKKQ